MAEPMATVTPKQFEAHKTETRQAIERLNIRVEVISHDTSRILHELADLREDMAEFRGEFEELRADFEELREEFKTFRADVETRFERLEKTVVDGNAALMSAILSLGHPR
jgi:predicted  nucleic acid-binding Zn-ribbon protein